MSLISAGIGLFAIMQAAYMRRANARAMEALPFDVQKDIGWQHAADSPPRTASRQAAPRKNMPAISSAAHLM